MRSTLKFLAAAAALGLTACGSTPSPATTVTCSTVQAVTFNAPAGTTSQVAFITQTYLIDDPGAGQTVMNDTTFSVQSDSPDVRLCAGASCTPSLSAIKVKTDGNGIGVYSATFTTGTGTAGGNITESFAGSPSVCLVAYSTTGT